MEALRPEGTVHCRTLWISDVHLGSTHCKAEQLLQLLKRIDCERIYLVGDIIDIWAMHKRLYWPESHNHVLRALLKKSRSGVEVIYIPGNHDANFREFCGSEFGNVQIHQNIIHETRDGRRMLVTHGDELDFAVRYSRINRILGDVAYELLMNANRWLNKLRTQFGKPYWSLARWAKSRVGKAAQAIAHFQEAAVHLARQKRVNGIICGHLHYPVIRQYGDVTYYNDGDWVENCTALLEDQQGELHLVQAIHSGASNQDVVLATV